jgi:hypothetical protein
MNNLFDIHTPLGQPYGLAITLTTPINTRRLSRRSGRGDLGREVGPPEGATFLPPFRINWSP